MDPVTIVNEVYFAGPGLDYRIATLNANYPLFAEHYPLLAEMISTPRFNIDRFNIVTKNMVQTKTQHKKRTRDDYVKCEQIERLPEIQQMFKCQKCKSVDDYLA